MKRCQQIEIKNEIKTEMKNVFPSCHGPPRYRTHASQLCIQGHWLAIYTLPGQAFPGHTPNLAQGVNFSKYSRSYTIILDHTLMV